MVILTTEESWEEKTRREFEDMARVAYNGDLRRAPKCPYQYASSAVNHAWFGWISRARWELKSR